MSWITDRLPSADDVDEDGDVLTPSMRPKVRRGINWIQAVTIKLGDPWMPAPPPYDPPKTREELIQELLDAIDSHYWPGNVGLGWKLEVLKAREALK